MPEFQLSKKDELNGLMIALCMLKKRGYKGFIDPNGNTVSLKEFKDMIQSEIDEELTK